MAWIESHQALGHHPKTVRLAQELKCTLPCAVGYLHFLWWWALDYAPDGLVAADNKAAVAKACMWSKRSEQFWAALMTAGFVEEAELPEVLRIHDWMDYAGRLVEKRAANAERMRTKRATHTRTSGNARAEHVQRTFDARAGATVPDQPDSTNSTPPPTPSNGKTHVQRTEAVQPTDAMMCYDCSQTIDTLDYKTQHRPGCEYFGLYPFEMRAHRGMVLARAKQQTQAPPTPGDSPSIETPGPTATHNPGAPGSGDAHEA
jgi:hypothetical protein